MEWAERHPRGKAESWFLRNPHVVHAELLREEMMDQCKPGLHVAVVTPHNNVRIGRLVMRSSFGGTWVMNAGGPHGTPVLVDTTNIIYLQGFKARESVSGNEGR